MTRRYIFSSIVFILFTIVVPATAQINLFSYSNNTIRYDKQFFSEYVLWDYSFQSEKNATYKVFSESCSSQTYKIELIRTPETVGSPNKFDGISISNSVGRKLLDWYPYTFLENVSHITINKSNAPFVKIPLDNDGFALLFGGIIFDSDNTAPEMVVIVVNKDEAKVVFDRPALAYSYTAPPNFSIEFVEEIDWIQNEFGNDDAPTANPLSSRTKYRIWREGNMLKYKSWK